LLVYAVLALGFGYRPLHVFDVCWRAFNESDDMHRSRWRALFGNPVAFLGALGIPLAGLVAHSLGSALRRLGRRQERATALLVLAGVLPVVVCIALGKPRSEVEHVYLLFAPAVILGGAAAACRWYQRSPRWLTHFVVPLLALQSMATEIFWYTLW